MKIEKIINRKICIGIIILLNCLVYSFCFSYNYLQDGDEFSSLAFPVYLAGGDWSNVVASTTSWHGYGHVLIYVPFFKFCRTWMEMYNVCRIGCLISWIFLSILIFYIASRFFQLGNISCLLISLVCTFGNLKPDYGIGLSVESELPIGIVTVVSMLLLFYINDKDGIKKKLYSFLLLFLIFYALSIHSRAVVLILTVFIVIVIEFILRRKMIISPLFAIAGAGSGFLVYRLLNGCFINNVLTSGDGLQASLGNDIANVQSSGITRFVLMFSATENIETVFEIFLSLLCGFVILSFGMISLFIVADIQYIVAKWRSKEIDNLEIGILVGLISFFLMNGFIAIKAYKTVLGGDKRWLIYLRYAMPFSIIIVFTGLVVLFKKQCNLKRTLTVAALINICMINIFLMYPLQDLKDSNVMRALANIFRQYFYNGEKVDEYFLKMIKVALLVGFLAFYYLKKNRQVLVWVGYTVISIVFWFSSINWHYNRAQEVYTYTDASEEVIRSLENGKTNKIKIYCNGKNELWPRYLRTNCPWSEISYVKDENVASVDLSNSIILSDKDSLDQEIQSVYKIVLDENEFLYTKNMDIYRWFALGLAYE